ncbi:MAG TPA: L,D-transpeptidase family protein [Methylocella sp.]|nr:L,D-transpeptidase family protein [Methylocella sp.]
MRSLLGACAAVCGFLTVPKAEAAVQINIDLSSQIMHVHSESGSYDWRVSTARSGYRTPRGTYRPYLLLRTHYSHKYHMSPMPYSIFFAGGYAIHGTYSTASLGRPASHGCIRLAPGNAALLFHMVQSEGAEITISGSPPRYYALAHRRSPATYADLEGGSIWHRKHHNTLAYVPARHAPPVRAWQANPVVPQWPSWP